MAMINRNRGRMRVEGRADDDAEDEEAEDAAPSTPPPPPLLPSTDAEERPMSCTSGFFTKFWLGEVPEESNVIMLVADQNALVLCSEG